MNCSGVRSPDRTNQTCTSSAKDILCAGYALDWQTHTEYKINILPVFSIPTIFPLGLYSSFYAASSGLAKDIIILQCALVYSIYELWIL